MEMCTDELIKHEVEVTMYTKNIEEHKSSISKLTKKLRELGDIETFAISLKSYDYETLRKMRDVLDNYMSGFTTQFPKTIQRVN